MKKTIYVSLMAFVMLMGCSKSANDLSINQEENQLKLASGESHSARTATPFGLPGDKIEDVLETALYYPPVSYTAPTDYPVYVASNYDLMAHFRYKSQEAVTGAVVEFTFPHIKYFVPHVPAGRIYTVNNVNNQTVITTITNLNAGWNPMFCFIVKVDCGKGKSGFTTFWTDMKINGVSVKGSIKNKVFVCN